jgi:hypothetical protein
MGNVLRMEKRQQIQALTNLGWGTERLPHLPGREAQVDFGKAPCRVKIDGVYKRVMVVLSRCPLTLCPTGIFTSWDYILQFIL